MRPEIAAAVIEAADFYDRLGFKAKSKTIRASPRFNEILTQSP